VSQSPGQSKLLDTAARPVMAMPAKKKSALFKILGSTRDCFGDGEEHSKGH